MDLAHTDYYTYQLDMCRACGGSCVAFCLLRPLATPTPSCGSRWSWLDRQPPPHCDRWVTGAVDSLWRLSHAHSCCTPPHSPIPLLISTYTPPFTPPTTHTPPHTHPTHTHTHTHTHHTHTGLPPPPPTHTAGFSVEKEEERHYLGLPLPTFYTTTPLLPYPLRFAHTTHTQRFRATPADLLPVAAPNTQTLCRTPLRAAPRRQRHARTARPVSRRCCHTFITWRPSLIASRHCRMASC